VRGTDRGRTGGSLEIVLWAGSRSRAERGKQKPEVSFLLKVPDQMVGKTQEKAVQNQKKFLVLTLLRGAWREARGVKTNES